MNEEYKKAIIDSIREGVTEVDFKAFNMQCIDVAASVLEQVRNFREIAGIKPEDVVVKSIPTDHPNEFIHVWVEIEGQPIDPDREAQTKAGDEIRAAIKKAEEENNIQINNQGLIRAMLSSN